MADISQLLQQIRKAKQDLLNALPELALLNTESAKGLVERKIREVGFGAKYSDRKVLAFYFLGHAKTKVGEKFIEDRVKRDEKETHIQDGVKYYSENSGMTWSELRQVEGLQTDHVDLTFTNKMWRGIVAGQPYFEGTRIICPLQGNSVEVINKLSWNFQRYGDFFGKVLTETEVNILKAALVERVQQILTDNGFKKQ